MNPKFSILCPSYNHENYIKDFIDSVLAQTYQDFELIIVDDCSTDKTLEIAKSYNDKRIKIITKEYNRGLNDSLNLAFDSAKGEYCCLIASDDMLKVDYLETIEETFKQNANIGVVYNTLEVVNLNGISTGKIIELQKADRFKTLNALFTTWNTLSSPGMAVKKDILAQIMPLNIALVNHQDYAIHIQILLKTDCAIIKEPKILYRYEESGESLSARSNMAITREKFEMNFLMNNFLNIKELETLKQIFPDHKEIFMFKELIPFYLGKMALMSQNTEKRMWGYNLLMNFIGENSNQQLLYDKINFTFKDYLKLADISLIENKELKNVKRKLKRYKKYFNRTLIITIIEAFIIFVLILLFTIKGTQFAF